MGYDELMYIMGAGLVHGIRGFHLYGLDLALSGGPTNPLSPYRFPPELLYWGASLDGPNDVDMVTRTHEAVQAFTCVDEGNNTTFNLLDALVDPDYEAMDEDEVFNANMTGLTVAVPCINEPFSNFLALREPDGDILVLVSTDGSGWAANDRIVFPNTLTTEYSGYGTPELLMGDWIDVSGFYGLKYDPQGYYLNPEGLSNMGFALIRIPAPGNDHQGMNTSSVIMEQTRSLSVSRNTGPSVLVEAQGAEVQIFDLTGRVVERIAQGECLELSSCFHPAGVYFAVLSEEDTPLFIEKLVLLDGGR